MRNLKAFLTRPNLAGILPEIQASKLNTRRPFKGETQMFEPEIVEAILRTV
jgi:hypothetical protein